MTASNPSFLSPSDGIAFVDDAFVPVSEARIPILDRGFVRSDATYDVVHVWKGGFFRLDDHIDRFYRSMAGLRMSLPYSREQLIEILHGCVRRSGLRDAYVQMTCTRGVPAKGSRDPRECKNRLYVFATPFVWIANEGQRRDGLKMIVPSIERIPSESLDQRIKNFHWLDLTMAIFEAYDRGATVPALPDRHGNITEGPGFNVFVVRDGKIATPDQGLFEGMTRRTTIELAQELQMPVDVRPVSIAELHEADEIFVTSTAGGVMPVTQLDGKPVALGKVGPITVRLHDLYWRRHDEGWKTTPVDYES